MGDKCWRLHCPNAAQTPQEVVEFQILALGATREENMYDEGISKCFEYASPANKAFTGPAERFGDMIRQIYSIMMRWKSYSITTMRHDNSSAVVLARFMMGPRDESFRWVLSKQ